jgi:hypothetical protein
MTRQVRLVVAQTAQVDDTPHARIARRLGNDLRRNSIVGCEVASVAAHRMYEVVRDVLTVHRAQNVIALKDVALDHPRAGKTADQACRIAREARHFVPALEQ